MTGDKPLKIFIVEDNPIYQELVMQALGSVSQDIHLFTSGESCLKEMHNEPSVIIMDYLLEGKMNGLTAIRKIRKTNKSAYVILFSTEPGLDIKENVLRYGPFEYLQKNVYAFPLLKQMIFSSLSLVTS
ncbi:MAG TPA: response regulator [Puia sp.]|jgi:CheY-like chemotaxis protein|nr:response regulator [Puia sp.]